MYLLRSGIRSVTHFPRWGEEKRICPMFEVGDAQSDMYQVGDGRGEEDLCHVALLVRSGGRSVTHVPSGGWGEERGTKSVSLCPCSTKRLSPDPVWDPLSWTVVEKIAKMSGNTGSVLKSGIKNRSSPGRLRRPQTVPDWSGTKN